MNRLLGMCLWALLVPAALLADGGVLIPADRAQPDPAILSLEEMDITVQIDNGDARVFIRQIFANHTDRIQEGNYIFALPSRAAVSDFAVWDGPTRIPAVVLERKRAEELYSRLRQQSIDPGLLQMGERGAEEAKQSSLFSARIVPIPAHGTKRLEFEYHQAIPVENLRSYFAIPLRPDAYQVQSAHHLRIDFELRSAIPVEQLVAGSKTFPLEIDEQTPTLVRSHFQADNFRLTEDFVATFNLPRAAINTLTILAYRSPNRPPPVPTEAVPIQNANEPGFFEAEAVVGAGTSAKGAVPAGHRADADTAKPARAKTVVVLMDVSLSMQWEKLERSYQALEALLRTLTPSDRFNLLLFNTHIQRFQPVPVAADGVAIQQALDFVRASRLRGGTDLQRALQEGLAECQGSRQPYLVLLSDGGATRGIIQNGKLAAWYVSAREQVAVTARPKTYIFAVGDDANLPLFQMLAREDGVVENVLSTEPVDFKLTSFLSKIGRNAMGHLQLEISPDAVVDAVYPLQAAAFSDSLVAWVGRYPKPHQNVTFTVKASVGSENVASTAKTDLPVESADHPQLPRLWARARVDALLERMQRDGEDQASIDEIIRLARQYKFATPYTSFLAAPRALLRPRVIRPGDPVLRVKADSSIVSVVALFPFGLTQKLRYLPNEDTWQTRFFAPTDMQDGTYSVRLVLRDRTGQTYRESKTFVIASKTPTVRIRTAPKRVRRGQLLDLKVDASQSTRTLVARLDGAAPVSLRWDARAGGNTGQLVIPEQMIPGTYRLTVTAEDIAHNMGSEEVDIEVVP